MNKRKMFIYVFLIMSAIFLITEQVYASTTPDNYNNYAYPMSKYKTLRETSFSLYTSGQTESIDPASGNLELRYTDLYLKGKNGLDFELARYYSLENANFWEPNVESSQLILVFYVQGYYITGTETREKYVNGILTETTTTPVYFCDGDENIVDDYDVMDTNFPNFIYEKYWKHSQHAQYMADKFNNGDFDRIEEYISGKDSVIEVIKYSEQADFNVQIRYQLTGAGNAVFNYQIGYTVYRNSNTAVEKFFNLGAGWAFDFPYIERRGDEDHYLHYGSKGTLYFNHNVNDWAYVHSRLPSGFQHIYGVTLEGYSLSDIKLYHVYGKDLYSNGQEREYFRLVEKGGKTLYFAMDGELLGIKDRFGNEIRFLHTTINGCRLISTIIDSVGRTIDISYTDNQVTVTVTDETDPNNNRVIYYNKALSSLSNSLSTEYVLESVTDTEGRITRYEYEEKQTTLSFRRKDPYPDMDEPIFKTTFACLKRVIYPTGGITEYNYSDTKYTAKNLGPNGYQQFFKVLDRADYTKDGTRYNYKNFRYHNYFNGDGAVEYDGYPFYNNGLPDNLSIITEVENDQGSKEIYTLKYKQGIRDSKGIVCTNVLSTGANHKNEVIREYNNQRLPIKIINRTYNVDSGQSLDRIENYLYDSFGNVVTYWDVQANGDTNNTEHKTEFTYHSIYNYLTSKTYKKDANTIIVEEYVPYSDDDKKIEWYRVKENGVLKKQVRFLYDAYGNVIEERNYLDDWTTYISTKYSYTDNVLARNGKFNGAYITRSWTSDVRNADGDLIAAKPGNDSGIIDEVYVYDWFGNMIQKQDGNGNITTYQYDKLNRIMKETNSDLSYKTWDYVCNTVENYVITKDENANSSNYANCGKQLKYEYDALGNLKYEKVYERNANGKYEYVPINEYIYDSQSRLVLEKNLVNGSKTEYIYDSNGRLIEKSIRDIKNTLLYKERYDYEDVDATGNYSKTIKTIEGDGSAPAITNITYINKAGFMEKIETPHKEGSSVKTYISTFRYDYLGNKIEEKIARAYDEGWSQPWTSKYEYNYAGQPTKVYNINGDYTTTEYDALGRVISFTDVKGNKANPKYSTYYTYDNMGRLIKEEIPFEIIGSTVHYAVKKYYYDRNGNIILEKVKNNKAGQTESYSQTAYEYNSRNMLTKVITYDGGVPENYTQYYYDPAGNKVRMYTGLSSPLTINGLDNVMPSSDTDYSVTKYEYDRFNRLVKMTDPLGQEENYQYDLNGNLIKKIDRNGSITAMVYDGMGRLLSETVTNRDNPKMNVSRYYNYTLTGNRSSIDCGAWSIEYVYDDLGRLIKEMESYGIEKEYTYDAANNRKSLVIKNKGDITTNTTYTYDNMNRLNEVYEDDQLVAFYTYDDNGNRESLTYINGNITQYSYNLANKLTVLENTINYARLANYVYTYYLDGNLASKSETVTNKTNEYAYDGLGRLEYETEKEGNTIISNISYAYDDYNNRIEKVQDGILTQYEYDKNNRLTSYITSYITSQEYMYKFDYAQNGNSNKLATVSFNDIPVDVNSDYTLSFEAFISEDANVPQSGIWIALTHTGESIFYDCSKKGTWQYFEISGKPNSQSCDILFILKLSSNSIKNGHILIKNIKFKKNGTTENLAVHSEKTGMIEVVANPEANYEITRYGYDNNGNQIYKATISSNGRYSSESFYEYNGFNQLIETTIGDKTINYIYSGNGLLKGKTDNNSVFTAYVWDGDQIALELNVRLDVTKKYVRGINLLYAQDVAGTRTWYLFNGHGDVVQLTNNGGDVTKTYDYDAFGNEKNPDPSDTNPFRYCGEYFDRETETYYLRARYYDPVIGRFITEDSYWGEASDPLSLNLYIYCKDNPIMYIDPTGHKSLGDVWNGFKNGVKKVGRGIKDFFQGVGSGALESITYGESNKIEVYYDRDNELIYLIGKTVGSGAMTVIGTISTIGCAAGDVIVAPTGVGELVTAPATVYCGSVTVSAATNTGANIAKIVDNIRGGSNNKGTPKTEIKYPGNDPSKSPGPDWEWRGKGDPGSGQGSWYNPKTGESLHPDLSHPDPIGPHWDYQPYRGGPEYRLLPDGTLQPK